MATINTYIYLSFLYRIKTLRATLSYSRPTGLVLPPLIMLCTSKAAVIAEQAPTERLSSLLRRRHVPSLLEEQTH